MEDAAVPIVQAAKETGSETPSVTSTSTSASSSSTRLLVKDPKSHYKLHIHSGAWSLVLGETHVIGSAPELHGSSSSGSWRHTLDLEAADAREQTLNVANLGDLPAVVLRGNDQGVLGSEGTSLDISWSLQLALHRDGLLLRLHAQPSQEVEWAANSEDSAQQPQTRLENISLAWLEVIAGGGAVGSTPPLQTDTSLSSSSFMSWLLRRRRPSVRSEEHSSFLVNGWQSFSFAGALHGAQPQPQPTLRHFSAAFHMGASKPEAIEKDSKALSSDMYGVLRFRKPASDGGDHTGALFAGYLSQRHSFGGVYAPSGIGRPSVLLFSEVEVPFENPERDSIETDWALVQVSSSKGASEEDVDSKSQLQQVEELVASTQVARMIQDYVQVMSTHLAVHPRATPNVGWCSWYCYGPHVNEELMMASLAELHQFSSDGSIPLNLVQLDDGWQSAWGDWTTPHPERFPNGLQPFTTAVRAKGYLPGLWFAPATCVAGSKVMEKHPEWLLRDDRGQPVKCGFTFPGHFLLALDFSHPGARQHIHKVVKTLVEEWGFGYLKCDFLHCAAMPSRNRADPRMSRATALHTLMSIIRKAAGPETVLVGCGAPLGPCVGHVDAMRISADHAPKWLPEVCGTSFFVANDRTNLPSARNMVRNVSNRMLLGSALWQNDPDCVILREEGTEFSVPQAQALASVAAMSAGSMIFSDPPASLSEERQAILEVLLPPLLPTPATPVDIMAKEIPRQLQTSLAPSQPAAKALGKWQLLAFFNWQGAPTGGCACGRSPTGKRLPASAGGRRRLDSDDSLLEEDQDEDAASVMNRRRSGSCCRAGASSSDEEVMFFTDPALAGHGDLSSRQPGRWHLFEFWTSSYMQMEASNILSFSTDDLSLRCGKVFAARAVDPAQPQYIGSNIHISCGREVLLWEFKQEAGRRQLTFILDVRRAVALPKVWLHLPGCPFDTAPRVQPAGPELPQLEYGSESVWSVPLSPLSTEAVSKFSITW
mmetsp:Transcript_350/g.664  ORF Transcript_350/g.664 Transcript_350/m.664 type:complete len:993 (+) Transcript_350:90-3068(+)